MNYSAWRIERNHKMQFCVVRDTPEGVEQRCSAGGKPSSFKTHAAAQRVRNALNHDVSTSRRVGLTGAQS